MKLRFLITALLIPLVAARAGDGTRLTLDEAAVQARAHNPSIRAALARWAAARDRIEQEGAWEDPQFSGMSRFARFVQVMPNGFADQTASIMQMLPLSGRNRVRARAAAYEALMAWQDVRRAALDAESQARVAYCQLANARAQAELNRQNLVLLQQIAEVSRIRYQAGSQGAADVLAAQTEAGKLLESAKDLDRTRSMAETRLNQAMGRDAFEPVGEIEEPPAAGCAFSPARLRALALENRPEVLAARYALEAARQRLAEARRMRIPDPTLTVQGQRYNEASQIVSELDAGVSLPLPWINGRKYDAAEREAAHKVAAAQADLDMREQEAVAVLRNALTDVETAMHHQRVSTSDLLQHARDSVKASEIAYEAGKMSLADWLGAAASLRDLEAMRRQQTSEYQAGLAQLESAIGAPLNLSKTHEPK